MKHPRSRAERRHNGDTWRNRQRYIMTYVWSNRSGREDYWYENRMWWARKQSVGHGSHCMCHYEKHCRKYVRKRRRALDAAVIWNLESYL